ncbi:MAG TPA: FMN-binding protein [Pseudonocardiaceae bacterium]|nr:FMN-binding protein [Pseudonocardiaceae bacterium]
MTATHTRLRRAGGLAALLGGIGVVVALKATSATPAPQPVALPPAAPTTTSAPPAAPATSGAPPATSTTSTTTAAPVSKTVQGDVAQTPYGPVQVALVMTGKRIVDVQALQLPSDASRSRRLAQIAAPTLRTEVLAAQSARIDTVSGATYTSQGYAESVQYALDHA